MSLASNMGDAAAAKDVLQNKSSRKLWTKQFLSICLINFFLFISYHILNPTFPFFIHSLGGSDFLAGLAMAIFAFAAILTRPITGWFLDNKGRKGITVLGIVLFTCIPLLYMVMPVLGLVIACRFIHGISWGFTGTATGTAAADIIPISRFTEGMGYFGLTCNMAFAIAPILGLWLKSYGFDILFLVAFVLSLVALFMALRLKYYQLPADKKVIPFNIHKDLININALPASIVVVFSCLPHGAIMTFIAIYAETKGLSGGMYFTVMAIFTAVCRLVTGPIVDRKGTDGVVIIGLIFLQLSLLCLVISNIQATFLLSALFFGSGFGFLLPALQNLAICSSPVENRGSATSTYYIAFDVGIGAGSLLAGWISGLIGYTGMYIVMCIPLFMGLFYYILRCRQPKKLI